MDENFIEQELKIDGLSLEDLKRGEENILKTRKKLINELKSGLAERIKNNPNEILIKPDSVLTKLIKVIKKIFQAI